MRKENNSIRKPLQRTVSKDISSSNGTTPRKMLERTTSLRQYNAEPPKKTTAPRRSDSLKKSDPQSNVASKRSGTSSLLSSRSSLNSTTSTSTVKRLPLKPTNTNTTTAMKNGVQRNPGVRSFNSTMNKTSVPKRANLTVSTQGNLKPPRPQALSFMKPTAASATKMNRTSPSSRLNSSLYRSKQ